MGLAITLTAGLLALLSLAAGLGALSASDRRFEARIAARLRREDAPAPRRLLADLAPRLIRTLTAWGERVGRGALEAEARGELKLTLVQAGFHSPRAAEAYFGIRAAAAGGLAVLAFMACLLFRFDSPLKLTIVVMVAANLGLFAPKMLLARRVKARSLALKQGLPDAIDLMVVAVEAGSTLSSAIQRVQAEFGQLHPVLAEHMGFLLMEMQAGASRAEALSRFAERAGIDEARSLATLLIQSEAVGASLGGTLRVFAEEMRKARFLEAERKAAELPVKMAFPLVFCIFPCLTGVIFVPIAIRFLRTMFAG
jgi:tight adherence protein C